MLKNKTAIINRTLHTPAELHVREGGDGESRTITGYAILFDTPSAPLYEYADEVAVEIISPTAITRELLDGCDIKMTMFHDRQLILARSKNGEGTLKYDVDERGVSFEFEAPRTVDGDKALELVRRGDIAGCSFMFATHYYDEAYVARNIERKDGKTVITYMVERVLGVYDFTLTDNPAYPDTNCEAEERELIKQLRTPADPEINDAKMREQVRAMRRAAAKKINY